MQPVSAIPAYPGVAPVKPLQVEQAEYQLSIPTPIQAWP